MPLKQTRYGGECPLGKFKIDPTNPGSYTTDTVEKCLSCNLSDTSMSRFDISRSFDLDNICQCPVDLTWQEYDKLKKEYFFLPGGKTKGELQDFIRQKLASKK